MKFKIFLGALLMAVTTASAQTFNVNITREQAFSVQVPDGNYRVSVTLGSRKRPLRLLFWPRTEG